MASHTRKTPGDRNLGMRIELARLRGGLTQDQLAELLGIKGAAVSHWEAGRHEPSRNRMNRLSETLHVSVGWLQGELIVTEEDRKLEEALLRLALDGGPELLEALLEFESAQDLLEYLRARKASEKP